MNDFLTDIAQAKQRNDKAVEAESRGIAEPKAIEAMQAHGLDQSGLPQDQFDYVGAFQGGTSFEQPEPNSGVQLPNKFLKPQSITVDGTDVISGENYVAGDSDDNELVKQGISSLRESSHNTATGANPQDINSLGKIALGFFEKDPNMSFEDYAAKLAGVPDDFKQQAYAAAQGVKQTAQLEQLIERDQINAGDYNFPQFKEKYSWDQLKEHKDLPAFAARFMRVFRGSAWKDDNPALIPEFRNAMNLFNFNVTYQASLATRAMRGDDEAKQLLYGFMVLDENMDLDFSPMNIARTGVSLATDPINYATLGAGGLARQSARTQAKRGMAKFLQDAIVSAEVGALYGAGWTAADDILRQNIAVDAGYQEAIDTSQTGKMAGIGMGGGMLLGASIPLAAAGGVRAANTLTDKQYWEGVAGRTFNSNSLMGADSLGGANQRGSMDLTNPQQAPADPYYLELNESLGNLPKKADAETYTKLIGNLVKKGKIKKDEYRWSDLDDFFMARKRAGTDDSITRQDIENHINENQLRLTKAERVGASEGTESIDEIRDRIFDEWAEDESALTSLKDDYHRVEYDRIWDDLANDHDEWGWKHLMEKNVFNRIGEYDDADEIINAVESGDQDIDFLLARLTDLGGDFEDLANDIQNYADSYFWHARGDIDKSKFVVDGVMDKAAINAAAQKAALKNAVIEKISDETDIDDLFRDSVLNGSDDYINEAATESIDQLGFNVETVEIGQAEYRIEDMGEYGDIKLLRYYNGRGNYGWEEIDSGYMDMDDAKKAAFTDALDNDDVETNGAGASTEYQSMSWYGSNDAIDENALMPYRELTYEMENYGQIDDGYVPAHFGENPLAHVRVGAWPDSDGNRYSVIQELQSDAHQAESKHTGQVTNIIENALSLSLDGDEITKLVPKDMRVDTYEKLSADDVKAIDGKFIERNDVISEKIESPMLEIVNDSLDFISGKSQDTFSDDELMGATKYIDKMLVENMLNGATAQYNIKGKNFSDYHAQAQYVISTTFDSLKYKASEYISEIESKLTKKFNEDFGTDFTYDEIDYLQSGIGERYLDDSVKQYNATEDKTKFVNRYSKDADEIIPQLAKANLPSIVVINAAEHHVWPIKKNLKLLRNLKANAKDSASIMDRLASKKGVAPNEFPMKNNWEQSVMRQLVRDAVENDMDRIAWPNNAEDIADIEGWGAIRQKDGAYTIHGRTDVTPIVNRYLKTMPKWAAKFEKKFGGDGKIKTTEIKTEAGTKPIDYIELTDRMKDAAMNKGFPMFELSSMVAGGAVLNESRDRKNEPR